MCTYQSIGLTPLISDSENGPEDAYWTIEISFPTNDIIVKWKLWGWTSGRINEVNLLLSNHLRERRGKRNSLNLTKDNYLKAFDYLMLWVLCKLPSRKGLSRLHMEPEQNIWSKIVWQHQTCFKAQAYHPNTTWFTACALTSLANFGDPRVVVEILLPMNCYSYG